MKFDVIVGNPPYQENTSNRRGGSKGNILWNKFVIKSLELLSDGGYLCFVHPSQWRYPKNEMWRTFTENQIVTLDCKTVKDGIATFGVNIGYDFYCLKKSKPTFKTIVKDADGNLHKIDFSEWPWLPNSNLLLIANLLAGNEEKLNVIYGCLHHTQHDASKNKNKTHVVKCVHTIHEDGSPEIRYSAIPLAKSEKVPKVIFHRSSSFRFIVDKDGKLGMTENCFAIAVDEKELNEFLEALKSEKFISLWESLKWSNYYVAAEPFRHFKKDFWKHFVNESGNELKH